MPIAPNGSAPYGPPQTIIDLIEGYRDRGFATPFTPDVLTRAGVSDGLVNRVLQSLRLLDLIDEDGHPTEQFEALRQARGVEEYKARLQEWLRSVYADVLQFADPAVDNADKVNEAFRGYNPAGQRSRMVTLMLGLFRHADLAPGELPKRDTPERRSVRPKNTPAAKKAAAVGAYGSGKSSGVAQVFEPTDGLPPGLLGLLHQIPRGGRRWTLQRRDEFLRAFQAVLDFSVPVEEDTDTADYDPWETAEEETSA